MASPSAISSVATPALSEARKRWHGGVLGVAANNENWREEIAQWRKINQ